MVPVSQKLYELSRKDAAQILKVSVRTLDRYISKRTVTSKNIAGRILLNHDEIVEFAKQTRVHKGIQRKLAQTFQTINVDKNEIAEPDIVAAVEDRIYRKLYEELKDDVKVFQQRLEGANYRVGQLESDLKASVPILDHQKLLTGHKKEVYNKKILYIILGAILALQPIWIVLAYF